MKSLFFRLLVWMWLTMTLLVVVFALIHAWAFPAEATGARRRFAARSIELRAEAALACAERAGADCARTLSPIDDRDDRVAIYRDGALSMGDAIHAAADLEALARSSTDQIAFRTNGEDVMAVVLPRDPRVVAVAVAPARSPWVFFIGPGTLPYRLTAIIAVTGIISFLLARWLTKPLRVLRSAAQRIAAGDLAVRVSPELAGADGETAALGRDMDGMTERLGELLEAQRWLLRDVSHELRSPLARLAISLELVRRKASEEAAPALDRIERETERLNTMIGELLTLSRLEAKDGLEETAAVPLGPLVEAIVEDASMEAQANGSNVTTSIRDVPTVQGHQELLRRAVENVVRNAVRFTEPGTTVDVALTSNDGFAELTVTDRGPGVPEAALERIFEPFYRVEADRARAKGGTGIGLAITQRAVTLHRGSVKAENADGGGLRVTVRLPLAGSSMR